MTGDVAAGTRKAFDETCLDGIGPRTRQNDGSRLGCVHCFPNHVVASGYDDDINLETHELGSKLRLPTASLRVPVLDRDVFSFYIAKLTQSQPNSLGTGRIGSSVGPRQVSNPQDFLRLFSRGLSLQEQAIPLQQGLMAPQPSSLRTQFGVLSRGRK